MKTNFETETKKNVTVRLLSEVALIAICFTASLYLVVI